MCGIVGYAGPRTALPVLLDSLRRVTYRGYDSFGVAVLNGTGIDTYRAIGPVDSGESNGHQAEGCIGIGHTRWATVGRVSVQNAHPHTDCSGNISIVHNGDIDNHQQLKAQLEADGHLLRSETDSECIAHLVERYYDQSTSLAQAVERACNDLQGCYATAVLDFKTREIAVTRRSSPVVIGLGAGEAFIASDAPAILPYTRDVVYPEDGDVVVMDSSGYVRVYNSGTEIVRKPQVIEWDAAQTELNGYEHFMLKEIHDQPHALRDVIAGYPDGLPELPVTSPSEVILLACGTSYHAAQYCAEMMVRHCGVAARACVASEYALTGKLPGDALVIAISQSGETADTLDAVRAIKAAGRPVVGVTNVPGSGLSRIADLVLFTRAGPEIAVAATKTFTNQLVVLAMIAARLSGRAEVAEAITGGLKKLPAQVQQVIEQSSSIRPVAEWLATFEHLFIMAKGPNYAAGLEAALKLKEVAYIHAEGVYAGELKHGPFALLSPATPVIALVSNDAHRQRMVTAVREVAARGAPVLLITDSRSEDLSPYATASIRIPAVEPVLAPVLNVIVGQLLSYYAALARGCSIDRPRNLAKSVTVP